MDEQIARIIRTIKNFNELLIFRKNATARNAMSAEVQSAVNARAAELGRAIVVERAGLDLTAISPAEEKIVETVSAYVGLMKANKKNANYTLRQLKRRGLRGAVESAVRRRTQGFETLAEADLADLSYEQIVIDNPDEFSKTAQWYARRNLGLPNDSARPPKAARDRNPHWSRDELILALDLYLRFRNTPLSKKSVEIAELSQTLRRLTLTSGRELTGTFRNPNGVYMKLMNFRSIDPEYTSNGRVGLDSGNELEAGVLSEFANNSVALAEAVAAIRTRVGDVEADLDMPYWVFVCNPKKWAIDKFFERGLVRDTWGVRPSDAPRFVPGQLGIVRVGVDQRSNAERGAKPRLEAGIYALCKIESTAYPGTGASSKFWAPGAEREPGWPTVSIQYLQTYASRPLTIGRLKTAHPELSNLLLEGFQGSTFPISAEDFKAVMGLLGTDLEEFPGMLDQDTAEETLADVERRYIGACPEVKIYISKRIERGPVGALVKRANGYKCQVCEQLGTNPIGFTKKSGEPYVEAHHVMPVSTKQIGTLAASNVLTVCANHHRQLHYGDISLHRTDTAFEFKISGNVVRILRARISSDV